MKAKKPVLLAVLILVLLAVALIVPAVASAKQEKEPNPNKPVAWVSYGTNSNNVIQPEQLQAALAVKQLWSGDTVGHVEQKRLKPAAFYQLSRAREFVDMSNPTGPASYFYDDGQYDSSLLKALLEYPYDYFHGKVAEIYPVVETLKPKGVPLLHVKWVLFDGGEPGAANWDGFLLFIWGPDLPVYMGPPMYVGPVQDCFDLTANVQIHITGDYNNPLLPTP